MRRLQLIPAVCALMLALGSVAVTPAHALGVGEMFGFDPFEKHQTLETPHFRITHAVAHAELARLAARHLEDAHRVLVPVMKWEPPYRTQVVIVDNSDFANGLAGAAGRLGMVLWTTPPDNWLSIAHYDDWFRMLCFHEYSHILNLDVTRDFYRIMRLFFGDSIRPNTLWQSWMLEGLATSQETSFTRAGRGRSSYYGMLRRGVWRAGMLKPVSKGGKGIGQITGTRTIPPLGEVAYFFGHELMNEFSAGDPSRLGELSYQAGASLPFLYNRNASEVSGKDWREHWDSWSAKASRRAEQEALAIETAGRTEPEWITRGNLHSYRPAVSPDGRWMVYARELYDEQPVLAIRDLQATDPARAERRLIENIGGGSVAFTASADAVVFSTVEREGLYRFFSQLWVHDLATGKSYALGLPAGLSSLRAKDPDIRGDQIVFTVASPGRVGVATGRLTKVEGRYELQDFRKLYEPELLGRASTPRLSPDGSQVVFSLHSNAETQERLMIIEMSPMDLKPGAASGARKLPTQIGDAMGTFDRFPAWIDTRTLVFSSNRTGVDNLYRYRLDAPSARKAAAADAITAEAITNVETGAWFSVPMPDGRLLATVYTPTGWDVAWIRPGVSHPPSISNEPGFEARGTERVALAQSPAGEVQWSTRPYSVYPSILPRGWAPFIQSSQSGGISASAMMAGFDALDLHRYLLTLGYDTGLSSPEGLLDYSNRRLGAVWSVTGVSKIQAVGETTYQREDSLGMSVSLYRPFTEAVLNPSLEWTWERVRLYSRTQGSVLAQVYDLPQLRAKVDFNDTDSSRQAIMPEEGWAGTLGHQWSLAPGRTTHELIWNQGHFFHLGGHRVLWPRWQLAVSDASSVQVEGRRNQLLEPFSNPDFDQLVLRGYPLRIFTGLKSAAVGSIDLRFPLLRVEQGWSNRPVFFEVLHALVFADTAAIAAPGLPVSRVSSWGLGVRGDWEVLNVVPLITALEYHQGLDRTQGGKSELFFQFKLGGISF